MRNVTQNVCDHSVAPSIPRYRFFAGIGIALGGAGVLMQALLLSVADFL